MRAAARTMVATVTAVLASATIACSPTTDVDQGDQAMDALATLLARPSNEDVIATYTRMEQEIRDAVVAVSPHVEWAAGRPASPAGCGEPFSGQDGITVGLPSWSAPQPVADADWPATLRAVEGVVARYGFGTALMKVDQPGDHQASFRNPADDSVVDLGTKLATVLGTLTGCHLPANVHPSP